MQWDGTYEGFLALAEWCGDYARWSSREDCVRLFVAANTEWLSLEPLEWVAKDHLGFYPIKDEVFVKKYEPSVSS